MKYLKTFENLNQTKLDLFNLKELYCSENQLPYNNLKKYKEWVKNNQNLIDNYGWEEVHKISYKAKKYNI